MSDHDDAFAEVREAAGEVTAALERFLEAIRGLIDDPAALADAIDTGRSVMEGFVAGLMDQAAPRDTGDPTAEGGDSTTRS